VIITRYLGPTNALGSRVVATHKRDAETTYRKVVAWDHALNGPDNHRAAVEALIASWPLTFDAVIIGCGHDHNAYYWLVVGRWQVDPTAVN
jgi:hypothetical protein